MKSKNWALRILCIVLFQTGFIYPFAQAETIAPALSLDLPQTENADLDPLDTKAKKRKKQSDPIYVNHTSSNSLGSHEEFAMAIFDSAQKIGKGLYEEGIPDRGSARRYSSQLVLVANITQFERPFSIIMKFDIKETRSGIKIAGRIQKDVLKEAHDVLQLEGKSKQKLELAKALEQNIKNILSGAEEILMEQNTASKIARPNDAAN